MTKFPAADAFSKTYAAHRPQVVWTELVADLETPVSPMLADLPHATRHSVVRQFEIGGSGQPIESRHGFLYA